MRVDVGFMPYYQYPIFDHRGTVVRLTDENGSVSAYYEYSAFGLPLRDEENPPVGNRFRYQSNWIVLKDSGGELALSPTRLYHSGVARYLQRDPLLRILRDEYGNSIFDEKILEMLKSSQEDLLAKELSELTELYSLNNIQGKKLLIFELLELINLYDAFLGNPGIWLDPKGLQDVITPYSSQSENRLRNLAPEIWRRWQLLEPGISEEYSMGTNPFALVRITEETPKFICRCPKSITINGINIKLTSLQETGVSAEQLPVTTFMGTAPYFVHICRCHYMCNNKIVEVFVAPCLKTDKKRLAQKLSKVNTILK